MYITSVLNSVDTHTALTIHTSCSKTVAQEVQLQYKLCASSANATDTMANASFAEPPCRSSSPTRPAPQHACSRVHQKGKVPARSTQTTKAVRTSGSAGRLHALQQLFKRSAFLPQRCYLRPVRVAGLERSWPCARSQNALTTKRIDQPHDCQHASDQKPSYLAPQPLMLGLALVVRPQRCVAVAFAPAGAQTCL